MDLSDPTEAALLCADALERRGLPYALFGGLALAAYGEPRETRDVDLAVVDVPAERARDALAELGVACAVAFDGVRFGGLSLGRVTLLGRGDASGVNVLDLVTPASARYGAALVARAAIGDLRGRTIRIVTPEDFVVLKVLASRERDIDDAASVLARTRDLLDLPMIQREIDALAAELPDVDVRDRWTTVQERAGT